MGRLHKKSHILKFKLSGVCFIALLILTIAGGCQSESRVFYEGKRYKKIPSKARLTSLTPIELTKAGYYIIGVFKSEPTTHRQTIAKQEFEENPQKILDSIAPENTATLKSYYESLDKEVCRKASEIGGQMVRLEKIERTYPEFRKDIADLMKSVLAPDLTVKNVTSIKYWSVWKHKGLNP